METRCILCDYPTPLRAIGAMVLTGNVEHGDGKVLCRRCVALAPEARKALRDQAMARMIQNDIAQTMRTPER